MLPGRDNELSLSRVYENIYEMGLKFYLLGNVIIIICLY